MKYDRQFQAFSKLRIAASLGMNSGRSRVITRLMALYTRMIVIPKAERYIKLFASLSE